MSNALPTELGRSRARSLILVPLILAAALIAYKTNSSIQVLSSTWASGAIAGRPAVVSFETAPASLTAFDRLINYVLVIWPALTFGVLIAASVRTFVSPRWIAEVIGRRSLRSQLTAGLAGAPLMLCSCCVAPVFTTVAETSSRVGPAIGLMLSSPVLNPAALALTFMLFEPSVATMRLLLAVVAVLAIGPLAERVSGGIRLGPPNVPDSAQEISGGKAARRFLQSLGVVSLRTIPAVIVGVFVSMLIVQVLPETVFASPGARVAAILVTATIALPLALPTFLEIPLALGLLAAGFPSGAALALLFAGPAINLPSLWSVARVGNWRVSAVVALSIWGLAVAGGLILG